MGQQGEDNMEKVETFADLRDGVVSELQLGSPLNAISLSGDQRYGVVGGRDLMKVHEYTRHCRQYTCGNVCESAVHTVMQAVCSIA